MTSWSSRPQYWFVASGEVMEQVRLGILDLPLPAPPRPVPNGSMLTGAGPPDGERK